VTTVKTSVLIAVLFAACAAQTQTLKLVAVHFGANSSTSNAVQFLCSQNYDRAECVKDATTLRQAMATYPLQLLGAWSFVLVPADDWKALVRGQGGDPVSPAFSMLDQRMTLLDSSLFVATASRNKELLVRFGVIGPALVDLAVTHEMGHGICQEKNERRADDYGRQLREGKTPECSKTPGYKPIAVSPNRPSNILPTQGQSSVEVHADGNGVPATVPRTDPLGYHDMPGVMDAMRQMWVRARNGVDDSEAGFSYDSDGTINFAPHSNQYSHESVPRTPNTIAVFHTHPNSRSARMSTEDIAAANQANVDMYVLSRAGLYHFKPGMKYPELLMSGTGFLTQKKRE
jgi:hypothetical protein